MLRKFSQFAPMAWSPLLEELSARFMCMRGSRLQSWLVHQDVKPPWAHHRRRRAVPHKQRRRWAGKFKRGKQKTQNIGGGVVNVRFSRPGSQDDVSPETRRHEQQYLLKAMRNSIA